VNRRFLIKGSQLMEQNFQLRDVFNLVVVNQLADRLLSVWPQFDRDGFTTDIVARLEPLSFGERNALIRDKLYEYLPKSFPEAAQLLIDALGPELGEPELKGYDGFIVMPQCDYVAAFGLAPAHYELSMRALYEMTKRFTAEGAIRAFLKEYPEETLGRLDTWADDDNCHVRRLVSEGTRPRLPLAPRLQRFIDDPTPVLQLLEKLKSDPVLLVRRSVANNLNDIAKDNPDKVVTTLQAWQQVDNKDTQWIIRHASRTLVKQGNSAVLTILGYPPDPPIRVAGFEVTTPTVSLGENLQFHAEIVSEGNDPQPLMIDYVIHHVKANGGRTPKVFKWHKKALKPGQSLTLTRTHAMKLISTRRYYAGEHLLELQINGQIMGQTTFELMLPQSS
jgi:3-methyladenine DNA glycosylase AlkC